MKAQASAPAAAAFDAESSVYDQGFGGNSVGLLFRSVFQERLTRAFAPGARVLDVGCGTGEDALFLARRGVRVHAVDVSAGMLGRARAKAQAEGLGPEQVTFERCAAEQLAEGAPAGAWDGACSDFGVLNCVALEEFGRALQRVLRPGAPVLFSVMGAHPLPAWLHHLVTGRGRPRGGRAPRVGGLDMPVHYPSPRAFRRAMGSGFAWRPTAALGVLVPDPHFAAWLGRRPRLFAMLAALEAHVRRWPLLRALGDHLLHEGRRL